MLKKRTVIALVSVLALFVTATPAQAHQRKSGPSRNSAPGQINGHPCGGDLPPCYVLYRETKGRNIMNSQGSGAAGFWQVMPRTWNRFRGYRSAINAPSEVQDDFARGLWANGKGCSHWRACTR